jgi:Chaperone of endosialidase
MKCSHMTVAVLLIAFFAFMGSAHGQQPPDVVQSDGSWNTAMGSSALQNVTPNSCLYCGIENTAAGAFAMEQDTSGGGNTAMGFLAMQFNAIGHNNTAVGDSALQGNTTGYYNTAVGSGALLRSTTAWNNTAIGLDALVYSTTGANNTALGANALFTSTTAQENTATGYNTLYANITGSYNTATGTTAMSANTTGSYNSAFGINALGTNQGGSNNVAIGANAGYDVRGGRFNIEIGNVGTANDAGAIRLGTSGQQTSTYIAGISNVQLTGSAVYISSTGQLGVLASSERYKTAIAPMEASSEKLRRLRPVTFHLKSDPKGGVQYGLIAEEVAKVYPELVIRDATGMIEGVRYEELAPLLLNEVQKQAAEIQKLNQQRKQFVTHAELASLKRQLQAALQDLQSKEELVAQR